MSLSSDITPSDEVSKTSRKESDDNSSMKPFALSEREIKIY
jgi:hypothetical protein